MGDTNTSFLQLYLDTTDCYGWWPDQWSHLLPRKITVGWKGSCRNSFEISKPGFHGPYTRYCKKSPDPNSKETSERLSNYGFIEVTFGTGEVNMPATIQALKQADYRGLIYAASFWLGASVICEH